MAKIAALSFHLRPSLRPRNLRLVTRRATYSLQWLLDTDDPSQGPRSTTPLSFHMLDAAAPATATAADVDANEEVVEYRSKTPTAA